VLKEHAFNHRLMVALFEGAPAGQPRLRACEGEADSGFAHLMSDDVVTLNSRKSE
jgi:hypothetical protein